MNSSQKPAPNGKYRGRIAPSPTGYLHLGHARTFWIAQERARRHDGLLVLRNEDLDSARSKPEFVSAMLEDLRWIGLDWQEGPDCGGPYAPYNQSERTASYRAVFDRLRVMGAVYPCTCSRQDVQRAAQAPHAGEDEPVYPGTCRPGREGSARDHSGKINWRFSVPDGEVVQFHDGYHGQQQFIAGKDFGDFVVWRHDEIPSYQLAVVVDDSAMQITEVVRGADLLRSTARQLLLYRALGLRPPAFWHCPLVTDAAGNRLAKRHNGLALRNLRAAGTTPEQVRATWGI